MNTRGAHCCKINSDKPPPTSRLAGRVTGADGACQRDGALMVEPRQCWAGEQSGV